MFSAAIFLPFFGALIAGLGGRWLKDRGAQWVTCGFMVLAGLLSIYIFYDVAILGNERRVEIFTWIDSGALEVSWALHFDTLTAVMVFVVNVVSAVIHVYSVGYMHHDPGIPRFFTYLSMFTFAMLMLVTSDNLLQMFFGWEGVGLCSYLLIGFWYDRPSANAAAIKAFIVNRVGDFGFALGIVGVFFVFDSIVLTEIFAAAPDKAGETFEFLGMELDVLTTLCILLFIGAMGKSAQVPLHTWLPDAMEGPTPVSALIHAATMVTAGVFMVCRLSPIFEYAPVALMIVAVVGASTAFFAATVALTQNDIKRVIAYSTCSQLGYMFFAAGVSAYPAAIFHLMTHAFFKALLFLGSGSVIHAMSDEQDMRKMGGIWRKIPFTYAYMWIGSLALAGVPFFAGYYSKDIIIESAWGAHTAVGQYAFWLGVGAAFMTAFYSWRLIYMTFHGTPRASEEVMSHVHESPPVMLVPLIVLAAGAIGAGFLAQSNFVGEGLEAFWRDSLLILPVHGALEAAHHVPTWVKLLPIVLGIAGILLATVLYLWTRGIPAALAGLLPGVYRFLLNKWYFDELFDAIFVRPAHYIGRGFWKAGDGALIDGVGPDGMAAATLNLARRISRLQTGYLYHYAFAILIGVAAIVTWYLLARVG
ncbi:MAG: NADH-quinone oxidoreductase subunit L [Alphaproteobacteria bacterium]|nr:NADH-quinone oxidoreductase subunit L [Alphaproteobacteria bacterium]